MSTKILAKIGAAAASLVILGLLGTQLLFAQPPGRGSISGRVLLEDGKPAVGLGMRLEKFEPRGVGGRGGTGERGESSLWDSGASGLNSQKGTRVVARTTTDQNGDFKMTNVEAGGFTLVGGNQKVGWIYQPVEVKPNEETKLGEIKLVRTDQ